MRKRDTEWDFFIPFFPRTLMDGTQSTDLVMRRRINGKWEYRKPTDAEVLNYESAWVAW
jgi:hypothetical protein